MRNDNGEGSSIGLEMESVRTNARAVERGLTDSQVAYLSRNALPSLRRALVELERMPCDSRAFTAWMRTRDAIKGAIQAHEACLELAEYFLRVAASKGGMPKK